MSIRRTSMRAIFDWLHEHWMRLCYGPPCQKHPGHHQWEFDPYFGETHAGLCESCTECWAEFCKERPWMQ